MVQAKLLYITKSSLLAPQTALVLRSVKLFDKFERDHLGRGHEIRRGAENLRFSSNKLLYMYLRNGTRYRTQVTQEAQISLGLPTVLVVSCDFKCIQSR